MNKQKIDNFWLRRIGIADARLATNFRNDGRLALDIAFVERRMRKGDRILDLGAGTCTLSQHFLTAASQVVAVEKAAGFLDMVPAHPKLIKVCADAVEFTTGATFDLILLFGVINFLTQEEELEIYSKCFDVLSKDGCLLVKNQCGISHEIIVDSYSEELQCDYHARYPALADQRRSLAVHFDVQIEDIYPAELNRWANTHFYGFVCQKPRTP